MAGRCEKSISQTAEPFLRGGLAAEKYMEDLNMSTNSRIGILHEDGTMETIYCH